MVVSASTPQEYIDAIESDLCHAFGRRHMRRVRQYLDNMLTGEATAQTDESRALFSHLFFPGLRSASVWASSDAGVTSLEGDLSWLVDEASDAFRYRDRIEDHSDLIAPVDDKHVGGWDCVYFLRGFTQVDAIKRQFPCTWRYLSSHRLAVEAFYSRLKAGSVIERHSDQANYVLTVHVALHDHDAILDVGGQKIEYQKGKLICFDSSYYHAVANETDLDRDILLFNIWHPDLTDFEISALDLIRQRWPEHLNFDPDSGFG